MKRQGFHYTREFDEAYEYQGKDLGSCCGAAETAFKIWAPFAERARLCLYRDGGSSMKLTAEVFTADCSDAVLTELSKPEEPDPSQPDDVQVEEIPLSDFAPGDKVVLTFPIPEEGKDEWVDVTQMQKTYLAEE